MFGSAYYTDVKGGMNSAFANSKAVIALQRNSFLLKVARYLFSQNLILSAVGPSSPDVFQRICPQSHSNSSSPIAKHASILEWYLQERTWTPITLLNEGDVVRGLLCPLEYLSPTNTVSPR